MPSVHVLVLAPAEGFVVVAFGGGLSLGGAVHALCFFKNILPYPPLSCRFPFVAGEGTGFEEGAFAGSRVPVVFCVFQGCGAWAGRLPIRHPSAWQ